MKKLTLKRKSNPSALEAFDLFIKMKEARNLSPASIKSYKEKILPFIRWLDCDNVGSIDRSVVDAYCSELLSQGLESETVVSYMRNVRVWLYFCMDEGWTERFKITMPKSEDKVKEVYSDQELKLLLKKPSLHTSTFASYRTWVFENYLLGTGNRLSTALNVRWRDVDFDAGYIFLSTTKNKKQQIIPLSKTLAAVLREYKTYRGGDPDDYVFCNCYGEKAAPRSYQDAVKRYNHERGVNKSSIHLFRHTFAKNWILSGGDVFRLQKILGHHDISMTRNYVNMFSGDLKNGFEDHNPLDKFSRGDFLKLQ